LRVVFFFFLLVLGNRPGRRRWNVLMLDSGHVGHGRSLRQARHGHTTCACDWLAGGVESGRLVKAISNGADVS
jgi:hypothetical protein